MKCHSLQLFALITVGSLALVGPVNAQNRGRTTTVKSVQQQYGIRDAYDGTSLHPDGRRATAVPVTMEDGRTGEFVIPSGGTDRNVYYRDDQTGDLHPMRMEGKTTRRQFVQAPRAMRYQAEPRRGNEQSWERDALIVGGSAGAGALIGAAAGGKKGAGVGAVAGGIGGLIFDLLSRDKR